MKTRAAFTAKHFERPWRGLPESPGFSYKENPYQYFSRNWKGNLSISVKEHFKFCSRKEGLWRKW